MLDFVIDLLLSALREREDEHTLRCRQQEEKTDMRVLIIAVIIVTVLVLC
ncbi:hypothetical protein HY491_02355 [Candidatus Woesearchaeota archaeon]|nr:hypothetical protein [Candidatus Woesearchaeota archaeon]